MEGLRGEDPLRWPLMVQPYGLWCERFKESFGQLSGAMGCMVFCAIVQLDECGPRNLREKASFPLVPGAGIRVIFF